MLHFLRWVRLRGCLQICLLAPGNGVKEEEDGDNDDDEDGDDDAEGHNHEAASRFARRHLVTKNDIGDNDDASDDEQNHTTASSFCDTRAFGLPKMSAGLNERLLPSQQE